MSKRGHRAPVVLTDFKAQKRDEGAVPIVDENDVTHVIDPPALWPDEVAAKAAANDVVGAATALLGEEGYEKWVAGGGTANLLMSIVEDEFGGSAGE